MSYRQQEMLSKIPRECNRQEGKRRSVVKWKKWQEYKRLEKDSVQMPGKRKDMMN